MNTIPGIGTLTLDQIQVFILMFLRIGGIIAFLPIFGSQYLPIHFKVGFTLLLTMILFPLASLHGPIVMPFVWANFVMGIIRELFIGMLIGYITSFLFAAVQFAGSLIDTQIGFSFVQTIDPFTETEVGTVAQLKILVFTIFFLLLNGHYFFILAIQKSFEVIPLMGVHLPMGKLTYLFTSMTAGIFDAGFRLAAPVFVTLFITTLAMGVIARTVPQINIFFVGLPLNIFLGLGLTALLFPLLAEIFKQMYQGLIGNLYQMLYLLA